MKSTLGLGDLERGEGEWKNMQAVVRKSFKDCIERLNGHHNSLEHVNNAIANLQEKLSSRMTLADVQKLLDSTEFNKKIKNDGHFQDRLDKLEYNLTKLGTLKSEVDRKADTVYVDSACAQKVDKTDVNIRALLSDTFKNDLVSLRKDIRDIRTKMSVQETAQSHQQQKFEHLSNTLQEMNNIARDMSTLKSRLDSYPAYSQLLSVIDCKADKSFVTSLTLAGQSRISEKHVQTTDKNYTSIHDAEGELALTSNIRTDVKSLARSVEDLRSMHLEHAHILKQLQSELKSGNTSSLHVKSHNTRSMQSASDEQHLDPLDGGCKAEDVLDQGYSPIKKMFHSNHVMAEPAVGAVIQSYRDQDAESPAFRALLVRTDSLTVSMQSLSHENRLLKEKVLALETLVNTALKGFDKVSSVPNSTATLTGGTPGTGTAAVAAGMQSALQKVGVAVLKADAAANKATRRIAVLETVTSQRMDLLESHIQSMSQKMTKSTIKSRRAQKGDEIGLLRHPSSFDRESKSKHIRRRDNHFATDDNDSDEFEVKVTHAKESTTPHSHQQEEAQSAIRDLTKRVESLEISLSQVRTQLTDYNAQILRQTQLQLTTSLPPNPPTKPYSPGANLGDAVPSDSMDHWETWRASVIQHVHDNTKQLHTEIRACQEAMEKLSSSTTKNTGNVSTSVAAMGIANSAHARAEEALEAVRVLRASQRLSNQQELEHREVSKLQINTRPENLSTSQHRQPSVWIDNNNYSVAPYPTAYETNGITTPAKPVSASARSTTYLSTKTPQSATSAAVDARLARLRQDKEELINLSQR